MDAKLYRQLEEYYAPYNEELFNLLGFDFGWNNYTRIYRQDYGIPKNSEGHVPVARAFGRRHG